MIFTAFALHSRTYACILHTDITYLKEEEEEERKKEEQFLQPKFPILTNFQKSKKRAIFYQISKINPLSCSGDPAFSFETIKSEKFLTGKKVVGL